MGVWLPGWLGTGGRPRKVPATRHCLWSGKVGEIINSDRNIDISFAISLFTIRETRCLVCSIQFFS